MRTIKTYPDNILVVGNDFENDVKSILLPSLTGKKLLLVTGQSSFQSTQYFDIFNSILKSTFIVSHLICEENPKGTHLDGFDKTLSFDCILAVGGGSVIDTAKRIKHLFNSESELLVIYTRFGSGSVVTPFFVYDNHEFKIGEHDVTTIPNIVYVSLELMDNLSNQQKIVGISDLFSHAVESYLSRAGDEALKTRAYSVIKRINTLKLNMPLDELVDCDVEAGLVESQCLVLLPHALGHYLTYTRGIPHGIASIIAMPHMLQFLCKNNVVDSKLAYDSCITARTLLDNYGDINAKELISNLKNELGIALPLIKRYMPFVFELSPIAFSDDKIFEMLDTNVII